MIWYVNSGGGRIGRFNPKSGEIKEWDSPSGPRSHPYGIVWLDGAVWYNESGMRPDMLVRFDIATETFQSWPIKSGNLYAGILRNARTTREGNTADPSDCHQPRHAGDAATARRGSAVDDIAD